jgi:GTP-binding protein
MSQTTSTRPHDWRSEEPALRRVEEKLRAQEHSDELRQRMAEWQPIVKAIPDQRLRVSIVGSVNTGKSTLFNVLTSPLFGRYGRKPNLANDREGLTRDAVETVAELDGMVFTVIDTPGVFDGAIVEEAKRSLQTSDVVLFVVSAGATTITPDEYALARMLTAARVPTVLIVNKRDLVEDAELNDVLEAFRTLGVGRGLPYVSPVARQWLLCAGGRNTPVLQSQHRDAHPR